MASTRFRDDPARIEDQLRQSVFPCHYMINAPGNGTTPDYIEDPQMRLQKWGANYMTNSVDLESNLKGIRPLNSRDCIGTFELMDYDANATEIEYPSNNCLYTEQSRSIAPAWELRDQESQLPRYPTILDPQENVTMQFQNNLNTRILEKDTFTPQQLSLYPLQSIDLLPRHQKQ